MKPILFESTATTFNTNGQGRLDPISCTVTEERNGQYELEMVISSSDPHYSDVREGRILLSKHDDTIDKQPFEIYQISRPLNGQVTVNAHHITYRTEKLTVMPFTASSIGTAMLGIQTNTVGTCPFTFWTAKTTAATYKVSVPSNMRKLLGGSEGSLLDVFGGGEYEWDNFTIKLHQHRGTDTGVVLRYGKDITDLKKTTDTSNVWTGVVPFWSGEDADNPGTTEVVTLTEQVIYASTAANFDYAMIVPLDLSSEFQSKPTEAQLRTRAQTYVTNNEYDAIPASIDVSFVNLAQTDEYQSVAVLQRLKLCDTLTILHTRLGISNQAKIVKVVYNVLEERYTSMTVGEIRTNLSTALTGGLQASLDDMRKTVATKIGLANAMSSLEDEMETAINEATDKLTGGSGGYVVLNRNANEQPTEILIMNTADVNTATQVLRMNLNGIGFSANGINGPYTSAWTLDGKFVADFIQAGTLNASLIKAGVISDATGNNTWDMTTGAISFQNLSWTASNSSMTSAGVLTCNGANITGSFTTTGTSGNYTTDITLDSGVISMTGNPVSSSKNVHFDIKITENPNNVKAATLDAWSNTHLIMKSRSSSYNSLIWIDPSNVTIDTRSGNGGEIRLWGKLLDLNATTINLYATTIKSNNWAGVNTNGWITPAQLYFINGICTGYTT